jgi:hypothetical protein
MFNIEDFMSQRWAFGKASGKMKKGEGMVADIVVTNSRKLIPFIIAEVKYGPFIRNYIRIQKAIDGKLGKKEQENVKSDLSTQLRNFDAWEKYGPSKFEINYYLKNTEKTIQLIKDFKQMENTQVRAYLCIIGEIYPDLDQVLKKEIEKFSPPSEFELLLQHYEVRNWIEEQLKHLESNVQGS